MKLLRRQFLRLGVGTVALPVMPQIANSQSRDFFEGKTLRILVGLQVGGSADTIVRRFSDCLRRHIPGNPTILVQNMTGAGSNVAYNYLAERAAPDGLTIAFSPYQALGQALGDVSLRARFENFEYLGGFSDTRVGYMRADAVPGHARRPSDIVKADTLVVGAYSHTDFESTLSRLSLKVLGVKHKLVVGYRGGADIFLAMQRGEVQFHNTSIGTYRTRNAPFIRSGDGIGLFYFVSAGSKLENSRSIAEMPAYPDLYREVHGKPPSGSNWDALNWLVAQTSELAFAAFAPGQTPPEVLSVLRGAFERAANDPEFIEKTIAANGVSSGFVGVQRGQAIVRSLAAVSTDVVNALRTAMGNQE